MIAISDNKRSISYQELEDLIQQKIQILKQHNLDQHRIMVVGQGSYKTIDDYIWVLAVIKNGGCAATITTKQSKLEFEGKCQAGNISAVISDNKITVSNHAPNVKNKEIYLCYTSGSTRKDFYECYPYYWNRTGYWGTNIDDCIKLAKQIGCSQPLIQIYEAPFDCAYGVDTMLKSYATGGRFHLINDSTEFDSAARQVGVNYMSGFPNSIRRMVEQSQGGFTVPYWELGGGYFNRALIEQIFDKFHASAVCNLFASSKSGYNLASIITDKTQNYTALRPLNYVHAELRNRVLYYKHKYQEWSTDGDMFEQIDEGWQYIGRSDDAFYNMENGVKIYTNEIENKAMTVDGVEECYSVLSIDKSRHNLMYCGHAELVNVAQSLGELTPYKIPFKVVKVKSSLFSRDEKISRTQLPHLLNDNPDDYINQMVLK